METIRLHEVEFLLKHLSNIEAAIEATRKHLVFLDTQEGVDEEIAAGMLSARKLSESKSGSSSDRTGETALKYGQTLSHRRNELREDLMVLELIRDKLEIGLNALFSSQRKIIEMRYFGNKTWAEISAATNLSISETQRRRKKAVELVRIISRIDVETYNSTINILKG